MTEAASLIRQIIGPAEAPRLTLAELALLLRHRRGAALVAPSTRAIYRWLGGMKPRPAALRSLREIAALTPRQRARRLRRALKRVGE